MNSHDCSNCLYAAYIGWTSGSRLGGFSRYLQVHFYNLTLVSAVQLEHPVYLASAVQQYQLHYSNDGINWIAGSTVRVMQTTSHTCPVHLLLSLHARRKMTWSKNIAFAVSDSSVLVSVRTTEGFCPWGGDFVLQQIGIFSGVVLYGGSCPGFFSCYCNTCNYTECLNFKHS